MIWDHEFYVSHHIPKWILASSGFINTETLTAANIPFAETTLNSTGKRLLLIALAGDYSDAEFLCQDQFGSEVLLTVSERENIETANFITAFRDLLPGPKAVWLRAKNPRSPSWTVGSEWIDPITNQNIPYHNLVQYEESPAALLRKSN